MSDPRATPSRSSKTAAVVMLVVFLQVLVVAVLGLGAISRDRKEARRAAEDRAERTARETLEKVDGAATTGLFEALSDLRSLVRRYADLELLRTRGPRDRADLIRLVYHVDPDTREILWLDGDHLLFVPPVVRQQRILRQAEDETSEQVFQSLLRDVQNKDLDDIHRILKAIRLIREFPYRQDLDGYPVAVGEARRLVPWAHSQAMWRADLDPDVGPTVYVHLENALLAALEVVFLNRDRLQDLPYGDRPKLEEIEAEVLAAIAGLPADQAPIRAQIEGYGDARLALEGGLLDVVNLAANEMGSAPKVVTVGSSYLIGLVPNVQAQGEPGVRHAVVLLNDSAVQRFIASKADAEFLSGEGLRLEILPADAPRAEAVAAARDLRQVVGESQELKLPYRAELVRIRPLQLPAEGPGELFYWGIIALAAGGLGMGAYVLSRLYTREVRLARLKADFVSNLSHELKTPLTSISMFTEMLHDGQLSSEEDRKEGLTILAQESQRLQSIVARMLETARREARGVPYELEPGDLVEVVQKSTERFRRIVTEPGLHLQVATPDAALTMMMDRAAIDDVVTNLITNAWKYRRGDEAHITVRLARHGRKAELVVNDDGIGISRRDRRKVFEMFFRADALLTKVSGTGLGLSLVRTIVRAHRGSIRVETGEGGRGTLFRVRFPLQKVARTRSTSPPVPVGSNAPQSRSEAKVAS